MYIPLHSIALIYGIFILFLAILYVRIRIKTLKKFPSSQGEIVEVRQRANGEKFLTLKGYAQGVSIAQKFDKKSYWSILAEQILTHCKNVSEPRVLMLGLGAGTIQHLLNSGNNEIHIDTVEYDEGVVAANKEFFELDSLKNHNLIVADAYKLLEDPSFNAQYNAIVIDLFTGSPPYVSPQSQTEKTIRTIAQHGNEQTLYLFNRPDTTKAAKQDNVEFLKLINQMFKEVHTKTTQDERGYRSLLIWTQKLH